MRIFDQRGSVGGILEPGAFCNGRLWPGAPGCCRAPGRTNRDGEGRERGGRTGRALGEHSSKG